MIHRLQITLTDDQYDRLLDESSRSGRSPAALVQLAIDNLLALSAPFDHPTMEGAQIALDESFGAWRDRDFDGKEYVDSMRRGLGNRRTWG